MAEVAALRHLGGMRPSRGGELGGHPQRRKTVLPSQEVDVCEDIPFERAGDLGRTLVGCSGGYPGGTPGSRLRRDEMPPRCPRGCPPGEVPAGCPCRCRACPEPHDGDSKRKAEKGTPSHAI